MCSAYVREFPWTSNLSAIHSGDCGSCLLPLPQHPSCSGYPRKSTVPLMHKNWCWATFRSQDLMLQVAAACLVVSYAPSPTIFQIFLKTGRLICSFVLLVTVIFFLSTWWNVLCQQIKAICCLNNYCFAWYVKYKLKLTVTQVQPFLFELSFPCQWCDMFTKGERKKAEKRNKMLLLVWGSSPWALQNTALWQDFG